MFSRLIVLFSVAWLAACGGSHAAGHHHPQQPAPAIAAADVGFVVAAPDRGFMGNEEVADAVAELAKTRNAALVYVTDERTAADLDAAIAEVTARGARKVVVLPLFVSAAEAGHQELARAVAKPRDVPVSLGAHFGASYLAVELLADRFRALHDAAGKRVVIAGYGATDDAGRDALSADLRRIAESAAAGFGFEGVDVVVWRDRESLPRGGRDTAADDAFAAALRADARAIVVPFQLGPKLDSMMTFPAGLARHVRGDATLADSEITPDPLVALWMAREANRHVPLADGEIGVVMLAHGSDHHWNEGMRDAVAAIAQRHKVEFAFSMADAPIVERAIRKLEARGARAIVVVRVFGLTSSFQSTVEQMLGLDVEGGKGAAHAGHGDGHGHGHGHGHGGAHAGPPPRIRSASLFATEGGLEANPRFAAALLDRAQELSKEPSKETVILVAHGSGDDATNEHWRKLLGTLAERMREGDGAEFRAIHVGTWREDWPGKREPEIAAIRALVEEASRDGGRALVIPARTTAQGPEAEFLDGLTYELGSGFAPHAEFEAWFEEQIAAGVARLRGAEKAPEKPAATSTDHGHHH
jgi:sirohydrochlorin ferrochelatase